MISITDGLQALYNSNMREKTPLELEQEARRLTNNWNELEEWLWNELDEHVKDNPKETYSKFVVIRIEDVLDKMKEIKNGGNNG